MAFRGELIRAWREAQGISQSAAANKVHLSQVFWQKLEAGEKQPSTDTLSAISSLTGITVDDLLGNPTQPRSGDRARQVVEQRPKNWGKRQKNFSRLLLTGHLTGTCLWTLRPTGESTTQRTGERQKGSLRPFKRPSLKGGAT